LYFLLSESHFLLPSKRLIAYCVKRAFALFFCISFEKKRRRKIGTASVHCNHGEWPGCGQAARRRWALANLGSNVSGGAFCQANLVAFLFLIAMVSVFLLRQLCFGSGHHAVPAPDAQWCACS
jgi:hypothetical protein